MRTWSMRYPGLSRAGIVFALNVFYLCQPAQPQAQNLPKIWLTDAAIPVYSDDPNDTWNRIFYFLFSRRFEAKLSEEFPEGAPFTQASSDAFPSFRLRVSTRIFKRLETGDRAIDPLYPSFLTLAGGRIVLMEPVYSEFVKVLQEALDQNATRSPLAKTLMQSDLWAAHDILSLQFRRSDTGIEQHRLVVVDLLARLIKKIALTPEEIQRLPDNYSAAARMLSVPDVFGKKSGWIEVQWFPERLHDSAASYRRTTRVFLKPAHLPHDMQTFLNALPDKTDLTIDLDGVALITQLLVVDSHGDLKTTKLTSEVQMRLFEKSKKKTLSRTTVKVYEISRRSLLQQPRSGGLVHEPENAPAYLPNAGNDYGFASNLLQGPTVQVKLKTRCTSCHGKNLMQVMTFSFAHFPGFSSPPVKQLDPTAHEAADFDMSQKEKLEDFKSLRKYFNLGH